MRYGVKRRLTWRTVRRATLAWDGVEVSKTRAVYHGKFAAFTTAVFQCHIKQNAPASRDVLFLARCCWSSLMRRRSSHNCGALFSVLLAPPKPEQASGRY